MEKLLSVNVIKNYIRKISLHLKELGIIIPIIIMFKREYMWLYYLFVIIV